MMPEPRTRDGYLWPPACTIKYYTTRGRDLFISHDRKLDLIASLEVWSPNTMVLGISSRSVKWKRWSEANLEKVEWLIRYDITFDGFRLRMRRLSRPGQPCTEEFRWHLTRKP